MVIVGAFARIEGERADDVRQRLARLPGVEPFLLDEPGKIGLIIEADEIDQAHAVLTGPVRATPGLLGVWPISIHLDEEPTAMPGGARGEDQGIPEGARHAIDPA
jgi:nitrate reductase NapAB chaperone NapD